MATASALYYLYFSNFSCSYLLLDDRHSTRDFGDYAETNRYRRQER